VLSPDAQVEQCPQIVDCLERPRGGVLGQLGLEVLAQIRELAFASARNVHGIEDAAHGAQPGLELVSVGAVEYELGWGLSASYSNRVRLRWRDVMLGRFGRE
jgi:hypothetical protein